MTQDHDPISDSYWVQPGHLLAGEYPGSKSDEQARRKLHQLLSAGVTFYVHCWGGIGRTGTAAG